MSTSSLTSNLTSESLNAAIIRTAGLTAASEGTCADCAVGVAASVKGSAPEGLWDKAGRPRNRVKATTLMDFDMLTQMFACFNNDRFSPSAQREKLRSRTKGNRVVPQFKKGLAKTEGARVFTEWTPTAQNSAN